MKSIRASFLLAALIPLLLTQAAYGLTLFGKSRPDTVPAGQSRIVLTTQLRLLEIDGKKYQDNLLNSGDTVVDIAPGSHAFTVRYDKIWDIDYDRFDALKSDPVTLRIDTKADATYRVTHRDLISYRQAKAFSNHPDIYVLDAETGDRIEQSANPASQPASQSTAAPTVVIAASPLQPTTPPATATRVGNDAGDQVDTASRATPALSSGANGPGALAMLRYWWQQASAPEQQEFMAWIRSTQTGSQRPDPLENR